MIRASTIIAMNLLRPVLLHTLVPVRLHLTRPDENDEANPKKKRAASGPTRSSPTMASQTACSSQEAAPQSSSTPIS